MESFISDVLLILVVILLTAPFELLLASAIQKGGSRDEFSMLRLAESKGRIWLRLSRVLTKSQNLRCPFCKNEYEGSDLVLSCTSCKATHHVECWNANGSCTVFGCGSKSRYSQN
jgi:hypothetical protein